MRAWKARVESRYPRGRTRDKALLGWHRPPSSVVFHKMERHQIMVDKLRESRGPAIGILGGRDGRPSIAD
jgi:hypothetical protein